MESAPGGVDDILLPPGGVDGLSAEAIESRGSRSIDAIEEDGDRPSELVLECVRKWLAVLSLYYGNG